LKVSDKSVGRDAETLVACVLWLRICADVANGAKHLVRNNQATIKIDPNARVAGESFFQEGFAQTGFGQESIAIHADGKVWPALLVADECIAAWDAFLQSKGLLPRPATT
jgi:hypothetical protein